MKKFGFLLVLVAFALPANVSAFCGFYVGGGDAKLYNDATQVVLMRDGNTTVLSMQNKYEGPPDSFAMVVPVPQILQKENVKTLDKTLFDRVDTLSAPRLVEYWEQDPCFVPRPRKMRSKKKMRSSMAASAPAAAKEEGFVKVRAQFAVGEYAISILETNDATTLDKWLKSNKYKIPDGAAPYFKPYIESGNYFFVAKVDPKKVTYKDGAAVLSPLRFHYKSDAFSLPIRLGMINSKGQQDLLVYLLSKGQRFDVANYPNVSIPTNIEVSGQTKDNFGEFYESLLSRTFEENPKAVVTEYAWAAQKCDPCPSGIMGGSGLRPQDIESLGNDVLSGAVQQADPVLIDDQPNKSKRRMRRGRRRPRPMMGGNWVLTRLHARYAKDGVGEDLVFKKAGPLLGGREIRDADGKLEKGSKEGSSNNFQGRYIIRNEWKGEVNCASPRYGVWGGPPQGGATGLLSAPSANTRGPASKPAKKVAFETLLKEAIPELKVSPKAGPAETAPAKDPNTQGDAPPAEIPPTTVDSTLPKGGDEPPKSGCSSTQGTPSRFGLLLLAGVFLRRRRKN